MVKIAIITYSTYGHIDTLAKAVQAGVQEAGGKADIYRVEETLPAQALEKLNAPPKPKDVPIVGKEVLENYDAFLFGIPTRYGNVPAQWSSFWDKTGGLWVKGTLDGKAAGIFVSTASFGGGQDSTIKNSLDYLSHHGMVIIPLGYTKCFAELSNIDELHGCGPWGAGTLAGPDGSRTASELELRVAKIQGVKFYQTVHKFYDKAEVVSSKTQKREAISNNRRAVKEEKSQTPQQQKRNALDCCTMM